ncbi:VOC family protein [Novosphingobium sp. JCM 18896]|uniref:VOC family protein n=1 Tax=Novosphingobium sp. JCM 18896 TaxID=2989731 RepID=UPI00222214C4|nr:VOC family protein [Novosphingobium sp. JCM 18896]MCW1431621.1 VOC family protein [Novosphingobium sp. JCM 18896]
MNDGNSPLERASTFAGLRGLLAGNEHFQCAYVTSDLDRACEVLGRRFGLGQFSFLDGDLIGGGKIRVAFAWAGRTMYEIIDASGPGGAFYTNRLPTADFAIRFHHLGFLLPDEAAWSQMKSRFLEDGREVVFETYNPGFMDAIYIDAPELGHYLEYIRAEEHGMAFFNAVPGN